VLSESTVGNVTSTIYGIVSSRKTPGPPTLRPSPSSSTVSNSNGGAGPRVGEAYQGSSMDIDQTDKILVGVALGGAALLSLLAVFVGLALCSGW